MPALAALASPLPATIPSTLVAGRTYSRAGHIDRRVLRIGVLVGVPTTIVGAILTRWIPGGPLILVADVLVLVLGLRVLLNASHDEDESTANMRTGVAWIIAIAGAVGFVSGLLGNSGGFMLAPLFINGLRMPVRRALGTSLLLSACIAVPGTIVHAWLGHIDWSLTIAFGLAAIPLAGMGAQLAQRLKARSLTLAFGTTLTTLAGGLLLFAR